MSDSTTRPSKQGDIYHRIREVSIWIGCACGTASLLYSIYYQHATGPSLATKTLIEAGITAAIVGVPIWGILTVAVYIFKEPKASSSETTEDPLLENEQTLQKQGGC